MGSIAVLLPEIILVTAALGSAVLGFLVGKRTEILWAWALVTLVAAMVLTLDMMGLGITRLAGLNLYEVPVSGVPGASGDLVDAWKLQVDTFTLFFHIVFMFVALLAVLASRSFIKPEEPHQGEYYCLLFLAVVGMMLTAAATDLFVLYLAFEISSISTFALVAFRKKDKQATEAALKFFIIGSVSSAIILFGISLVYGVAGSSRIASVGHLTDLAVLKGKLSTAVPAMEAPLIVAIVFLLAGFGFKVAVVPFHMWAPGVYQWSLPTLSTFLAVAATATAGVGEEIGDYKGLGKRMPFVAAAMAIFLLSLAGIPPMGGFVSKFLLFSSAVSAMQFNPWFLALAVSGVLNSALSLYYYARVIWYMWILDAPEGEKPVAPGRYLTIAIGISFVLIILTGLAALPFIDYIQGAARTFFGF